MNQKMQAAIPRLPELLTGFVTNFFDTLGIGSFAPTTAVFKFAHMVPDELIPGTLNVGHCLPVMLQAIIFMTVVQVDMLTLLSMITGAVVGAWFGAGWVARLPRRQVQFGVGAALLVAFIAMLMRLLNLFPGGGEALALTGTKLAVAVVMNGIFGAISTLGIGFYAPCMTLVSLLGMNPTAAFPIMMVSGALLMPAASWRFLQAGAYSPRIAAGLTIGGLLGVPIAAYLVKSLPLDTLRWVVMAVILYAALTMLRSAMSSADHPTAPTFA